MENPEKLAADIIQLAQGTLLVRLRFLEPAVAGTPAVSDPEETFDTDGFAVYYGFMHVLRSFHYSDRKVVHDWLHMILHLVFHHPFQEDLNPFMWDLACDAAVENIIDELNLPETQTPQSFELHSRLQRWREQFPVMTAERIYHALKEENPDTETLLSMQDLFRVDTHSRWYAHSKNSEDRNSDDKDSLSGSGGEESQAEAGDQKQDNESDSASPSDTGSSSEQEESKENPSPSREEVKKKWEDISARIQTDLETVSKRWAEKSGSLLRNIKDANREKNDYKAFLERFCSLGEVLKVSSDEFDYIYYTYGMELYGNTPLIEPLEYTDEKRIRDFAIVIDTSASVDENLARAFIRHTFSILETADALFSSVCIHIISCDARVHEDYVIRKQEDIPEVFAEMRLHGSGGTDFREAFKYVDRLVSEKAFTDFRGLLYFTDGLGTFPAEKPDYEAAFVFVRTEKNAGEAEEAVLPPWAVRIVLDEECIKK